MAQVTKTGLVSEKCCRWCVSDGYKRCTLLTWVCKIHKSNLSCWDPSISSSQAPAGDLENQR